MKKISLFFMFLLMATAQLVCQAQTMTGDLNNDDEVDVLDVTTLIEYILTDNEWDNAFDLNSDNAIDVLDVTALIEMILTSHPETPSNETFTVNGVTFTMVYVENGTFMMGATDDDNVAFEDERPRHEVTLSSYYIGQTEVTQELWMAVMGTNPSYFTPTNGFAEILTRPVEFVSWDDCQVFIAKLNELTGRTFRLPTEAEWEFAARGGNQSQGYIFSGSNVIGEVAWWNNNAGTILGTSDPNYGTHAVATKKANELGIYDMSGNVSEWCQDRYGSYSDQPQVNPTGPASGSYRVFRGGYWSNLTNKCRVCFRHHYYSWQQKNSRGFRLAM